MRRLEPIREAPAHRVVITENLAGVLLSYLTETQERERGGVLLGHRNQSVTWVSMAVFPPQLVTDHMACEFDVGCLGVIHNAKDMLQRDLAQRVGTIVGWVHSHPRLGLFLSPTDEGTLSAWRQLDAQAVAVVADPYLRGHTSERLAWWRVPGPGHRLTLDASGPILTIAQVATVGEAINRSADSMGRWDIVTARAMLRIIAGPSGAGPWVTPADPSRTRNQGQPIAQPPEPRPGPAQPPGRNPGQNLGEGDA
jgi:proteasome lid subunit RPN8/RPN11